jgi:hypothetical protein
MRSVSSAPTIPAHQQFVSRAQALLNEICCPGNFPLNVLQRLERLD